MRKIAKKLLILVVLQIGSDIIGKMITLRNKPFSFYTYYT